VLHSYTEANNDCECLRFFFPYAIFEVPSNVVLKLMKPSIWISILMVTWGIVSVGTYLVHRRTIADTRAVRS
jgi:hypothetical protein